jgi:hypothetical protein
MLLKLYLANIRVGNADRRTIVSFEFKVVKCSDHVATTHYEAANIKNLSKCS